MGFSFYYEVDGFQFLYWDGTPSLFSPDLTDKKTVLAMENQDPAFFKALVKAYRIGKQEARESYLEVHSSDHVPSTPKDKGKKSEAPFLNSGYIYLIQADSQTGNGYYKIGRSKNLFDRIKTFQVKLPFEIELVHQFEADDMIQAEAGLHRRYGYRRVNGEWFDLKTAMVAEIMEIEKFSNGKFQMV